MRNRKRSYRIGIRFFPHIIPIGFPLIFPLGLGLALKLFHLVFPIAMVLLIVVLAVFIMEAISQKSAKGAWNSMLNTGNQWKQRFTSRQQQSYYQPSQPYGQEQPYYQPSQPYSQEQPYYQPSQPYGQEQPYYQPSQPIQKATIPNHHITSPRHKLVKSNPTISRPSPMHRSNPTISLRSKSITSASPEHNTKKKAVILQSYVLPFLLTLLSSRV